MPITVERFQEACAVPLKLALLAGAAGLGREIADQRVQKTGLGLTGEVDSIHEGRIQVLGETEIGYLANQDPARRGAIAEHFFSRPFACAVVGGGLAPPAELVEAADRRGIALFSSALATAELIEEALRQLVRLFAETTTIYGVLVEVVGVGVLLLGPSGIGKSECALDLIVRGHRFVADDVIHLEKRGPGTLLGGGSELTRHHMEIRGLGIINIRDLFGPAAIVDLKKIELAVRIEAWDPAKEYDRLGLGEPVTDILGVAIPTLLIPVSPGRNLATIIEVAVRNHILKGQGVFSARDLVGRQNEQAGGGPG